MYKTIPSLNPSNVLNTDNLIELTKRYKEIMFNQQEVKAYMWKVYGLGTRGVGKSPHREYLQNLIHDSNSAGGTVLSTLLNMDFYESNGWRDAGTGLTRDAMFRTLYDAFSKYLLLEQSVLMYYTYDIGDAYKVKGAQ